MSKVRVRLFDELLTHQPGLSMYEPTYIEWDRYEDAEVCVFTDTYLPMAESFSNKRKIGILLEPRVIFSQSYDFIQENHKIFDYVLTHEMKLININPEKFLWIPGNTSWIQREDMKVYPKTKDICMIASTKEHTLDQRFRNEIASIVDGEVDVFGWGREGRPKILNKLEIIKDYRFCIEIENGYTPCYFTEKLLDPLAVGTVPIYYCMSFTQSERDLPKFIDKAGTIPFVDLDMLTNILHSLKRFGEEQYQENLPTIRNNLSIVKHMYYSLDDYIYTSYPFLFE